MPPILALLLTVAFVVFLFTWERRRWPYPAGRISCLPFIWILIECSRGISAWLVLFGVPVPGATYEGGNPVDRVYYIIIIALGLNVLRMRRVRVDELIRRNMWLALFLGYCLLAVLWSDYPLVAAKRWIKVLGCPVMALIILTEAAPRQALIKIFKQVSFILIPVSILFIKYFPEWGRGYDEWSGMAHYVGITTNKNHLGLDCMILGFFWVWYLLSVWKWPRGRIRREEILFCAFFLLMNQWLFVQADSKTSLMAFVIGVLVLFLSGSRVFGGRLTGTVLLVGVVLYFILDSTFHIYANVLTLLGRDPTLTDRTLLWASLLEVPINPVIGTGFESFWLGWRREMMWEIWAWRPNQAHNGYLDTYLNLGVVGLGLLVIFLWASYWRANRALGSNFEWARFCLGFLVAAMVYNWTEAGFKLINPIMLMLYLVTLQVPSGRAAAREARTFRQRTGRPHSVRVATDHG